MKLEKIIKDLFKKQYLRLGQKNSRIKPLFTMCGNKSGKIFRNEEKYWNAQINTLKSCKTKNT